MPLETTKQVDALLQLYRNTHNESLRYRDLEWRVTVWIVTLVVGVSAAVKWLPRSIDISMRAVAMVVVCIVCSYGLWHLHYVHRRLTDIRNRYRECERLLGFYEPSTIWASSLFPESEKDERVTYFRGWEHLLSWALTIVGATAFALITVWNWK